MNFSKEFQQNGVVVRVQGYEIKNMMTIQQCGIAF
jgi:hypothetical protein